MYPEPFAFLGIHFIRSYGVTLAVSFLLGVFIALKRAKNKGISPDQVIDLSFIVLLAALIGSRFFYVIYHVEEFSDNLLAIVNPFQADSVGISGLSMMGGVILSMLAAFAYFYFKKVNPWPLTDILAPLFLLGIGITRIGCFLNGCCFGLPTDCWCGVTFPYNSAAGYFFPDSSLLPTQLFESAAGFILFFLILRSERFQKFSGHSFLLTMAAYSLWRFSIDFFRYYESSMIVMKIGEQNYSRNQLLSLIIFTAAITGFVIFSIRSKRPQPDD